MDDEFFDEDEAIDYILYEEIEKSDKTTQGRSGCLGTVVLFFAVGTIFGFKIFI